MTVIKVENLGKKYLIGHEKNTSYNSMRESINYSFKSMYQRIRHPLSINSEKTELEEFWALKNINFEIKQGDKIGIIGHNGAGKTTLLKLLSRITQPTTGNIKIKGRIASLLEVGTGFHPELSGRENIYLNGAILGMKRVEIKKKFDEIVAFAEVEKFLDTPVKRYSSGMYVRLAFAVAAHLEPEILLVDEVLAVGDAAFQKKSLGKMESVSKEGRTIVFISHNMLALQSLCENAFLIEKGILKMKGDSASTIKKYLKQIHQGSSFVFKPDSKKEPINDKVRIVKAEVRTDDKKGSNDFYMNSDLLFNVEYFIKKPGLEIDITIHLYNEERIIVLGSSTGKEKKWHGKPFNKGFYKSRCQIPGNLLNSGNYSITLQVVEKQNIIIYKHENVLSFRVMESEENRDSYFGKRVGVFRPFFNWESEFIYK